ncbi:hypothetical protein TrST_g2679 [Triparma strigata]|uniref:Uncharacterized protein n=1 Tax=Triparma strigata TaxID=1606541 RepID=A0A9W7BVA7_9STRA|nr:hypothetical protein TrST_g2679 [Triparma strigata]
MTKSAQTTKPTPYLIILSALYIYLYQLAGIIHLYGHNLAARFLGIPSHVVWPVQRLVPGYGWYYNLDKSHSIMMNHIDDDMLNASDPPDKILYGYAGIVSQLIYMLVVGSFFQSTLGASIWGSYSNYMNVMFLWTILYIPLYAIHFYDDATADFAFFTGACHHSNASQCMLF